MSTTTTTTTTESESNTETYDNWEPTESSVYISDNISDVSYTSPDNIEVPVISNSEGDFTWTNTDHGGTTVDLF